MPETLTPPTDIETVLREQMANSENSKRRMENISGVKNNIKPFGKSMGEKSKSIGENVADFFGKREQGDKVPNSSIQDQKPKFELQNLNPLNGLKDMISYIGDLPKSITNPKIMLYSGMENIINSIGAGLTKIRGFFNKSKKG